MGLITVFSLSYLSWEGGGGGGKGEKGRKRETGVVEGVRKPVRVMGGRERKICKKERNGEKEEQECYRIERRKEGRWM